MPPKITTPPPKTATAAIHIIDLGSQYTRLLAKRLRQCHVYTEVHPYHTYAANAHHHPPPAGVVLSGSPASVHQPDHPTVVLPAGVPALGVCYGAQLLAHAHGLPVLSGGDGDDHAEYGAQTLTAPAHATPHVDDDPIGRVLASAIAQGTSVWMSHGDSIVPPASCATFTTLAHSHTGVLAAFRIGSAHAAAPRYGVQFHPEVTHTACGADVLRAFACDVCGVAADWTPAQMCAQIDDVVRTTVAEHDAARAVAFGKSTAARASPHPPPSPIVLGVSGGVDSTVAAYAIQRICPDRLVCVFVDHGLLRHGERDEVVQALERAGIRVHVVDAADAFFAALRGVTDPEAKRKCIGSLFVDTFAHACKSDLDIDAPTCLLAQGTIYPDVIESASPVTGAAGATTIKSHHSAAGATTIKSHHSAAGATTIKSHHNVGGLPESLPFAGVLEPLRMLFKDDVRALGRHLGVPPATVDRHPFPGPGLAIRVLGEVTRERVRTLQHADRLFTQALRTHDLYDRIWQAGAVLLPVRTVGVMGDGRTYQEVVALRAVTSVDGMTAECYRFDMDVLAALATRIGNEVRGVSRVVYDVSSKPPATIEWE